jgi:hypothetical protein
VKAELRADNRLLAWNIIVAFAVRRYSCQQLPGTPALEHTRAACRDPHGVSRTIRERHLKERYGLPK